MLLDPALFLAFMIAALALNVTPGADMTFVAAQSLGRGRKVGLAAALGVGAGAVFRAGFAALGLAALLAATPGAFDVIRYLGAAYLVWMAVSMIRNPPVLGAEDTHSAASLLTAFQQGLFTNLANPKVIIFVLAFLPQFVDPARAPVGLQIFLLGLIFGITGTLVLCAVALMGDRLREIIAHHPLAPRFIAWTSGTLIGGLAIGLLLAGKRAA